MDSKKPGILLYHDDLDMLLCEDDATVGAVVRFFFTVSTTGEIPESPVKGMTAKLLATMTEKIIRDASKYAEVVKENTINGYMSAISRNATANGRKLSKEQIRQMAIEEYEKNHRSTVVNDGSTVVNDGELTVTVTETVTGTETLTVTEKETVTEAVAVAESVTQTETERMMANLRRKNITTTPAVEEEVKNSISSIGVEGTWNKIFGDLRFITNLRSIGEKTKAAV